MPQFFVKQENVKDNEVLIDNSSDINHIINVLRFKKGDNLVLVSPDGITYFTEIFLINSNTVHTKVIEQFKSDRKLNFNITLAQSILKSAKQDFVIQKATELGVNNIIPFFSKNTVVQIESPKDRINKIKRWQKIAYESSKQCQRINIPDISYIGNLNDVINLNNFDVKLVCSERDTQLSLKEFLRADKTEHKNKNVLIIIGPEGGWDTKEIGLFKNNNISLVTLGNLILRAETAAITAISDVIYEYEL